MGLVKGAFLNKKRSVLSLKSNTCYMPPNILVYERKQKLQKAKQEREYKNLRMAS